MTSSRRSRASCGAEIPDDLVASFVLWARLWRTPGLGERLVIEYSCRLRKSLARSLASRRLVRLNPILQLPQNARLLPEVLCHEAAHVAVFELHGPACRPHGPEWIRLVTRAGFSPRLYVPVEDESQGTHARWATCFVYEHRCPVCQAARLGRRPVPRWRCADCVSAGLDGHLLITRRPSGKGAANDR
jgi:predicted SprT family Zn-dependent metalloprotease